MCYAFLYCSYIPKRLYKPIIFIKDGIKFCRKIVVSSHGVIYTLTLSHFHESPRSKPVYASLSIIALLWSNGVGMERLVPQTQSPILIYACRRQARARERSYTYMIHVYKRARTCMNVRSYKHSFMRKEIF